MHKRTERATIAADWKKFERRLIIQHWISYLLGVAMGIFVSYLFVRWS